MTADRRSTITKMFHEGQSPRVIAEAVNLSERQVCRLCIEYGLRTLRPLRTQIRPEVAARIRQLLDEGMPATWVAEDVGMAPSTIYRHFGGTPHVREWKSVWSDIRTSPALLALHNEVAAPPASRKRTSA